MSRSTTSTFLALLLSAVPGISASADEASRPAVLAVGDVVAPFTLPDQNDAPVAVDQGTALLLLTRDMDGGALVKEALAGRKAEVLSAAKAAYVSDLSGMPSLVRGAFAMPALRKREYPVALDTEGKATAAFPHQAGKATVIRLDRGRIVSVTFASTSAEVAATLGL